MKGYLSCWWTGIELFGVCSIGVCCNFLGIFRALPSLTNSTNWQICNGEVGTNARRIAPSSVNHVGIWHAWPIGPPNPPTIRYKALGSWLTFWEWFHGTQILCVSFRWWRTPQNISWEHGDWCLGKVDRLFFVWKCLRIRDSVLNSIRWNDKKLGYPSCPRNIIVRIVEG